VVAYWEVGVVWLEGVFGITEKAAGELLAEPVEGEMLSTAVILTQR
jgi:hypothetical protein